MRPDLPIACNLAALSPEQRRREGTLLADFKEICRDPEETATGFRFVIPHEPSQLAWIGEFLALERLCCPFLDLDLSAPAGGGPVTLHVHGGAGAKSFLRSVFLDRSPSA